MGCLSRLGCLTLLLLVGGAALLFYLLTRPVGPRYADGAYRYTVDGEERVVSITPAAARRFDALLRGEIAPAEIPAALSRGVVVSESELNSRLAEEVAARSLGGAGVRVERVFIRLLPGRGRAYIATTVAGQPVTVQQDVLLSVAAGQVNVTLGEPRAGRLPVGAVLSPVLAAAGVERAIEEAIARILPVGLRSLTVEEGSLRAVPAFGGRALLGPWPGDSSAERAVVALLPDR